MLEHVALKDTLITGRTLEGAEIRAHPIRLARHHAVFEVYSLSQVVRASEVIGSFQIVLNERTIYLGKAVVKNLIDTGPMSLCEAALEDSWVDIEFNGAGDARTRVRRDFHAVKRIWERLYQVDPQYKLLTADMQNSLADLRLWLDQVELGIQGASARGGRETLECGVREGLEAEMFPLLDAQFERFEAAAGRIPPDLQPIHAKYARRLLHPVVLGAPFAFRCIQKPLGYAGDYEVVNMILRHAPEGNSLYHRLLNRWFTSQAPAVAHRNRIAFLVQRLVAETLRVRRQKRPIRIFNLGCGPAGEIQEFLSTHELSDAAHFDLLDFNQETLDHTRAVLSALQQERGRQTQIEFSKKSVAQYLKAQAKAETAAAAGTYDLAYCAGLFDYLPDSVCKQLIESMYAKLAPGGLLLATNVDPSNPIRNWLGLILEWHLIYRDGHQMRALAPAGAVPEQVQISSDLSGVNVFLEVRKPVA